MARVIPKKPSPPLSTFADDEYRAVLSGRVERVEGDIASVNHKVDNLSDKFDALSAGLFKRMDQISHAYAQVQAQNVPYVERLGFVKDGAVLFAMVCAGIVYMTQGTLTPALSEVQKQNAVLEYRIKAIESRVPVAKFALSSQQQ